MSDAETARLTADVVLLGTYRQQLHVLLIRRGWAPFQGQWALPGGHVEAGEDTEVTAARELFEETGIAAAWPLHPVGVFAAPSRDPRGRYVTFAYRAHLDGLPIAVPADGATDARWWPVDDLLTVPSVLAFDHAAVIRAALTQHHSLRGVNR